MRERYELIIYKRLVEVRTNEREAEREMEASIFRVMGELDRHWKVKQLKLRWMNEPTPLQVLPYALRVEVSRGEYCPIQRARHNCVTSLLIQQEGTIRVECLENEKQRPRTWRVRCIPKKALKEVLWWAWSEERWMEAFNRRLVQVIVGGDVKIVVEEDTTTTILEVLSERQARSLFGGGYYYDEEGKQETHPIRLWFQWPQRRRYLSTCVLPGAPRILGDEGGCYNLWQAKKERCSTKSQTKLISSYFHCKE